MGAKAKTSNFTKGFTQVPHRLGDILPLLGLTLREYRVVLLIIRLTYGCQRRWAELKLCDLQTVNIAPPHAGEIMAASLEKKVIVRDGGRKKYRVNEEYLTTITAKEISSSIEKLRKLVGRQLSKKSYQNGNKKVTKVVSSRLPEREVSGYQNSKNGRLPEGEVSALEHGDFSSAKDTIKQKVKYSDKKDNAGCSFSKVKIGKKSADPHFFSPRTDTEYAALRAWNQLEPENRSSFGFYLSAAKKGLPVGLFHQFCSEIQQDKRIVNKGAVFVNKAQSYFKNAGIKDYEK